VRARSRLRMLSAPFAVAADRGVTQAGEVDRPVPGPVGVPVLAVGGMTRPGFLAATLRVQDLG
jgi:hypothetical protein